MKTWDVKLVKEAVVFVVLALTLFALSGCATGSAIFGPKGKDTSVLVPGAAREEVIVKLGMPHIMEKNREGDLVDTWVITETRGVLRPGLDILSLGLWKVISRPLGMDCLGECKTKYMVTYDKNNRIKLMQAIEE